METYVVVDIIIIGDPVIELPIRDGNLIKNFTASYSASVIELPIRDGN